jgi:hypothetical protein
MNKTKKLLREHGSMVRSYIAILYLYRELGRAPYTREVAGLLGLKGESSISRPIGLLKKNGYLKDDGRYGLRPTFGVDLNLEDNEDIPV